MITLSTGEFMFWLCAFGLGFFLVGTFVGGQ